MALYGTKGCLMLLVLILMMILMIVMRCWFGVFLAIDVYDYYPIVKNRVSQVCACLFAFCFVVARVSFVVKFCYVFNIRTSQDIHVRHIPLFHNLNLNNGESFISVSMITIRWSTIMRTTIKREVASWKGKAPYLAYKITERIDIILDTHSKKCTWQIFYIFNV